jgi:dihydrofolate reductase
VYLSSIVANQCSYVIKHNYLNIIEKIGESSMRKVLFQMLISLDGYFEGPDREIDWHNVDSEFNDYAINNLNNAGILLFGRITYELMAGYWPTEHATTDDPVVAGKMNSLPKIVFSKTRSSVEWNNTTLVKDNFLEEVLKLKQQQGKDMVIFGSSDLAVTFMEHDLIDEFQIFITPVILGKGKPLFSGIKDRYKLKLLSTRTFGSGNVLLCYQPEGK